MKTAFKHRLLFLVISVIGVMAYALHAGPNTPSGTSSPSKISKGSGDACSIKLELKRRICLTSTTTVTVKLSCKSDTSVQDSEISLSATRDHVTFSRETVTLSCGEETEVEVGTTLNQLPEDESDQTVIISAEPEGDCSGLSKDMELDTCRVDVSPEKDEICPGETITVDGSYICQKEDCSEGFDWSLEEGEDSPLQFDSGETDGTQSIDVTVPEDQEGGVTGTILAGIFQSLV